METKFSINRTEEPDWDPGRIAPQHLEHDFELAIPLRMQRDVDYPTMGLKVRLDLVFSGERIEIMELRISSGKGFVATQYLTHLSLPKVIRAIAIEAIPDSSKWQPKRVQSEGGKFPYRYLAELYWFEHITWGAPRSTIMEYTGWSRANTNWHIRRIAKQHPLPGPHAAQFGWVNPK